MTTAPGRVTSALDRVGALGGQLLPWGILGFMGAGLVGGEVSESVQRLVQQNGGVLLIVAIAMPYLPRAIDAQRQQAEALGELSAAVKSLAERDSYQQQELRGVLHVVAEDLREVRNALSSRPCEKHRAELTAVKQ
jgi:hypothetical protein